MKTKLFHIIILLFAVILITNCDGVWKPADGDVIFVSAQFIDRNTLELVYKSSEKSEDLEKDYRVKIKGNTRTYEIKRCVTNSPVTNKAYHYKIQWNVSPDLAPGDTVTISTKYYGGPEQYVDVPNY